MNLRRITVATTAAVLLLAAPAAASTSAAAAGPSATPLLLELALAAVVVTGFAVRRPAARALGAVRRTLAHPRTRAAARARRV
jgi:hypothetical protein